MTSGNPVSGQRVLQARAPAAQHVLDDGVGTEVSQGSQFDSQDGSASYSGLSTAASSPAAFTAMQSAGTAAAAAGEPRPRASSELAAVAMNAGAAATFNRVQRMISRGVAQLDAADLTLQEMDTKLSLVSTARGCV